MSISHPHIVTVLQTRLDSFRLPSKSIMPLCGEALFVQQYKRVAASNLVGTLVVATTTEAIDNAIEELCLEKGIACFRGHPTDLLDRHYQAALRYNAEVVI
jgi:spore coat polysaccharide biosynthesis protein SpsF